MAHEGFSDRIGGVVAGRDEDGVLGVAIHKYDQEFMAVVRRQRSHNVNGQRIPRTLKLDSAGRFLAMSIVGAQIDIGDSSERFQGRYGGRPCENTGHGRASIIHAHRGGRRYGAPGQSCGFPLRPPRVVLGEHYLLGEVGRRVGG